MRVDGRPDVPHAIRPTDVMSCVGESTGYLERHEVLEVGRLPPRLLEGLSPCRLGDLLALLHLSRRKLPAPGIRDETVAPQEKDLVLVVQERGDRNRRLAKEVVIEMTAVRQFHIGDIQTEPLVRAHGLLTDGVPTQGEVSSER